jgi:hypothetical protein
MLQDHRQIARDRFARVMRVPDVIVASTVMGAVTWPLWMAFDNLTVGKPIKPEEAVLFFITAAIVVPLYFLVRLIAAAAIAAITTRRAAARQAARLRSRHSASSALL